MKNLRSLKMKKAAEQATKVIHHNYMEDLGEFHISFNTVNGKYCCNFGSLMLQPYIINYY